jgi:dihydroceramide fatty acyl 2-hydroxylase
MFFLAPHPKLDRPQRGSPRMFTVDLIEKYFSRVKPWHIVGLWTPFILWALWSAVRDPALSVAPLLGMLLAGVVTWTLMEYGLHRFIFHYKPNPDSTLQRDLSFLIHGIHHDYPWDADRLVMPPVISALIAVGVWFPTRLLLGAHLHPPFFAGLVGGYVWYDLTHYYLHHGVPTSRLGKWLRRYHLVHHFSTPEIRYGITTPLWDLLFSTYPKEEVKPAPSEDVAA